MNFVFISPNFPHTYWEFCQRLHQNGANVLGIADTPYEELDPRLRDSLTEYYRVGSLEDYDQVYRAVAFLAFKHGKIDWIESNNEYWLQQDARLRTDFHVTTGIDFEHVERIKEKSQMNEYYAKGHIPAARQIKIQEGADAVLDFANKTGYPLIAKPNVGVGASDTHKLHDENELRAFLASKLQAATDGASASFNYVIEEFITGEICSYDAVIGRDSQPLFESMTVWPPSIMDIVNKKLDLAYYVDKTMPDSLRELGRRTVKTFGVSNRFVHLEFFRLDRKRDGLGDEGDFVALEVNMRPAGGYTPDMINYAHSTDIYKIWADMVTYGESHASIGEQHYCAFASRRDIYNYAHSHEEVLARYGKQMVMCERMPDIFKDAMGQQMYTVKLDSLEEVREFVAYVHQKA